MPPVSQAQRRAMYAAAQGKSTIGIPKKVAQEFTAADKPGKLPPRARGSNTTKASSANLQNAMMQSMRKK